MDLWQDFGQKVDLTASIRQILLSYPEGTAVLKELIQNADDAGASTVKFCLDFRRHGTGSLAYEKLAQFQGPSLLVFNDGVFSEADFASISRVGDSVKREQTGKTGRFGIGFNSCYHLCDLPSFVSGRHLALFDPHCDYLPAVSATNPGKKIDFVANPVLEAYPDQFAPFCAFGCDMRQPFPATLFRFPLRTSELAAHSRISKQAYDTHKVQALLASLQHEAMDIMLFLKTVQRLEIHEWRPGQAEPTRLYSCHLANTMPQLQLERSMFVRAAQASKAAVAARAAAASMLSMHSPAPAPSSIPSEPPDASPATSIADGIHASSKQELPAAESSAALTDFTKPLVMFSIHEATFEGRVDGSGAAAQRTFLIAQALGGGAAAEMAAQASAQFRVALTPWGAVAAPLDLDTDTGQTRAFTGSAFCFLPLPVQTGLPVHVNSFFELSSNRRDIWYGSDMAGAGQLRSDWNVCLLNEVVAPTYAKLLTAAAQKLGPCPAFFRLWPADVGGLREPWRGAARRVLEEVAALPVVFTAADGGQWLRPAKAVYTEAATVRQLELEAALLALNLPLAQLPTAVAAALLRYTIPQPQLLSPGLARDWIRSCAPQVCNLHQRHPQQITPLLQYCLADLGVSHGSSDTREAGRGTAADGLVAELSGLPLLPLCDGSLGSFAVGPAEAAAAEAAVLFVPTALERLLLQGAWHLLVDVAAFPEALIDSLQALARHAATNLRLVTATELADRLLPLLLPPRWRGQAEALQGFSRLDAFASWPIVPVHGGLLTALRPLSDSVAVWVGDTWPASLAAVLHKLGCRLVDNAPDLRHPALSQHVHSADGLGILAALRNSLAGVPQERWPGLLAEGEVQAPERRQLRRFLLQKQWYEHLPGPDGDRSNPQPRATSAVPPADELLVTLKGLPVFECHRGPAVGEAPGFASLLERRYLAPAGVQEEVLDGKFLVVDGEAERQTLTAVLGVQQLARVEYYRDHILPRIGQLAPPLRDTVMLDLLHQLSSLLDEDASFAAALRSMCFVPARSGQLQAPETLYDPRNPELVELLDPETSFPEGAFATDAVLGSLQLLGMRSAVDTATLLQSARYVDSLRVTDEQAAFDRAKMLLEYLKVEAGRLLGDARHISIVNGKGEAAHFWAALGQICWCPVICEPPAACLPWPAVSERLVPPRCARPSSDMWLVSGTLRVLDGECSEGPLAVGLGWTQKPPASVVAAQLKQVGAMHRGGADTATRQALAAAVPQIYTALAALDAHGMELCRAVLEGAACVWVGACFATVEQVAISGPLNLAPWLYVLPGELAPFRDLLLQLGVPHHFSPRQYVSVLHGMREAAADTPLTAAQLEQALSVVQALADMSPDASHLFAPDSRSVLAPVSDLVFNDAPWTSLQDVRFVHPKISHEVAERVGVGSLRRRMLAQSADFMQLGLHSAQAFGQSEALTTRLKHIIDAYADGPGIIMELIQNADDAGATEVALLLDDQTYACNSIISPQMAAWQGPALCVYNDAVFSPADFSAISRIGQDSKLDKPAATGRFGLGWNAVYHLTDVPSFVSGDYLVAFDPHARYLPGISPAQPGLKIAFQRANLLAQFPDSFSPYLQFGCTLHETFQGTLFRFPLRSEATASTSDIKAAPYSPRDVLALFEAFRGEAGKALLFLKSVTRVAVHVRRAGQARPKLLFRASLSTAEGGEAPQAAICRFVGGPGGKVQKDAFYQRLKATLPASLPSSCSLVTVALQDSSGRSDEERWLVCNAMGGGRARELAIRQPKDSRGLLPWPGQAFCFLPLPVRTGLPVHVNGYFELSSNRRDIWYGSDMAGGGKARSDWNVALLEDALAPALANMLVKVAQVLGPTPAYYRLWPTGHVAEPWAFLVQRLYGQASSLPVAWTDACGGRWLPVQDAFFPDAACRQSAPLTAALVTLGVNLVSRALPEPVARNFLAMTPGAQEVTPAAVRRHLLQHKQQLGRQQGSQAAQAAGLLQYCLSGIDCEDAGSVVQLARLPLAVMASAELRTFTAGTSEPMYVVAKEDLQLLHRNADCLIAWDTSTPLGSSLARVAKTGALNLRLLTAEALAATFLPRILPARWRGISTVQWTADDGQQPTVKTMQALWTRLAAFEDLSPLQQWPLLPVKGGRLCRLSRAAQVVQEGSWAEAVGTALAKLGCHVLDAGMLPDRVQHTQLLKYVHPSSGAGILAAIGAAAESDDVGAHAMQLAERADLTAAERQQLRTLLLQGRWFGSSEASCIQSAQLAVLKALPIFESAYRPGGDNGDDIQPFALAEHNHAASESDEEADSASTDSSSDSDAANSPGAAPPEPPAASLPDLSPTPPTVPPPTRMRKPQQRAALFVDLQGPRYLAPEGVHPGVLTAEFLRPGSASEAQLLVGHLGVQQLSAVDFLLQHVFPRVGSLPASPRDDLMLDLVRDLHAAEPAVVAALKQVAFVPTSGGKLLAPQQLYDPAIPALRALLDADACFPAEAFASDVQVLAGLRMLGLRSSIGAEALLQAARSLEGRSLADGQAEERGRALLAHLDALAGEAEDAATCAIWAPLSTIAWCPVLSEAPHPGMPWPSTANVRDNSPPDRSKAQHSTGFAAPSTVRPASDAWLVSATLRILDGTCSAALAERLGWAKPLPSAALVAQLVELGKRHEVVDDAELQETLASTAAELYRQLADRITGTDAEIILPALRHSACVWVDRGFAPASITALSSPVDYRPYLFTVPETLTPFRDMLLTIGVPEEFRAAHCVHGLRRIHEAHEGVALTPDQLLMACLLAKNLAILKEQGSAPPGVIHLPDQAGVMEAAAHLYFNDADWLMEESNRLVHPDVDQLTAEGLGVQSLRYHHQVDTQMTQNMRAKPAAELKAALEQQPAGMLSALWDLLEVADAAGADAIDIVMDMRTHPSQSLLQPALAAFQGPALCVSIRGVALSVAELFALQCPPVPYILRNRRCSFGSGLLNSYQFCDLPSMVSGEYLLLFDSLGSHVGASSTSSRAEPMVKQYRHLNSDLPARFGDQFAVWDFAGVDIAQQRGTLARFPLRTAQQANTSSIHKVAWTPAQMQQAVEEFAGGVGGVLLFLRGLRSVRLISWPAEGTPPHVLHEVTASPHLPDARVPFDEREWRRTTFSLASILNSKAYAGVRKALSFTVNSRTGNGDIQRDSWLVSAVSGVDSSSPSKASSTAAAATAVHRHPTAPFLLFGNFVVDRSQGRRIYGLSSEAWSEERVDQAGEAASPPATPAAAHMQRLQLQMREREREAAALNAQFNQELLFSCGTAAWLDAFELLRDRLVAAHRPCAPLYELIPDMPQGGEQSLMTAFHQQICRELAKRQCWQLRNGRMVYLRDGCFLQAAVDDLGTAALDFIQREFPLFKVPWRVKVALEAAGVAGTRDITPAVVRAMLKQYVGRAEVRGGRLHLRPAEAAELLHFCCGDLWAVGELPQEDRTGHPPDSAGTAVGSLSAEMVASINQVLPRGVDVDTLISSMRDALGLGHYIEALVRDCVGLPVPVASGMIAALGHKKLLFWSANCTVEPPSLMDSFADSFLHPQVVRLLRDTFSDPLVSRLLKVQCYGLADVAEHLRLMLPTEWRTAGGQAGFLVPWRYGQAGGPRPQWLQRVWDLLVQIHADGPSLGDAAPSPEVAAAVPADQHWAALDAFALLPCTNGSVIRVSKRAMVFTPPEPAPAPAPTGPVLTAVAGMHRELPDTVKASMLVYDAAFLALYAKVGIPVLKEPDLLLRVLLPNHSILSAALQNASLQYIARNWGALENNAPLVGGLAAAAFIPSGTGELRRPSQLYDPSNKLLARVFRGQDVFPTGMFAHASWLKVLRKSGLHSSIDRDVFLACARRVEARYAALPSMPSMQDAAETASIRREVLDTAAELAAFFKANVASMHSVQFAAAVREIVFVPALKGLPGHPDSQRVLIKFSAAALRKDWALVWTVRGTLEEAHAPPQMFGNLLLLRSPPLLDTVCKHLHKVGQNHGEEVLSSWPSQAGTPKAACKAILVHLAAQGLSDEQCGRLREAAFVPVANCTRLVAPAGLFARLRDDLAPFAYQVPTALASHMEILKKLGARDMPTAGDLLSILQGVRGHFGPSALNINDCRAVMRLLQYITSHQAASLAVPIQRALQHGHISVPARTCHLVNAVTCVHAASAPSRLLDRVDPSKVTFVHPQLPLAVCTFLGIPALEGVVEEVLDAAFQPQYVEEIQGLSCGAVRQLLGSGQFARAVHAVVLEYARDLPSLKAITLKTIMQQLHIAAEGLRFVQSCATRIVLRSSRADVTRSDASMRVDEYMYTPPGGKPLLFVAEPPPDIPVKFVLARAIKRCLGNRVPISVRDLLDCTEASLPHLQRLLVAGPGVAEDEALSAHGQLGSAVLGTDLALMTIKPLRSYITGDLVGYRGALDPQAAAAAAARARAQDGSGGAGGIQAPLLYGRVTADARPPPGAPAYRVNVETAPGQFRDILSSQLYCFRSQPQPAGEGADASSTEGSPRSAAAPASSSTATRPPGPSGPKGPSSAADVSLEDRMAALREMLSAAELPLDLDRAKLIEELQALRDERAALSRDLGNTQQELHQLKEEAETEAGQSQCRVCLTRKMDAVIIPCGHALCGECAGALRNGKCPMCRATGTVHRLFL
ncbi:hypothetical protein WJX72_002029 [[Myrmecia] bisecta]|uniref:RING-type domain-containing protein n=1 Tax=[Myrmecia] bisecta TaxID=41462 RepID=A0AAW1PL41_9CHLO